MLFSRAYFQTCFQVQWARGLTLAICFAALERGGFKDFELGACGRLFTAQAGEPDVVVFEAGKEGLDFAELAALGWGCSR